MNEEVCGKNEEEFLVHISRRLRFLRSHRSVPLLLDLERSGVRGKPASFWVDQSAKAPLHNGNVNADLAILQFGPDVIPILISTLKKKEEPLTDLYAKVWPKIPIVIGRWLTPPAQKPSPAQYRASAAKMLGRLGKFGSPATRGLKKALKDKA